MKHNNGKHVKSFLVHGIPASDRKALRIKCAREEMSLNHVVKALLARWLKGELIVEPPDSREGDGDESSREVAAS